MAKSHRSVPPRSEGSDESTSPPQSAVVLGGDQVGRLCAALQDAFTRDQLRQLLVTGLEGNLTLDAIVPVQNRNLHDICYDLVRWSLRDERVGLQGLLAAAVRTNPGNPKLLGSCRNSPVTATVSTQRPSAPTASSSRLPAPTVLPSSGMLPRASSCVCCRDTTAASGP